MPVGNGSYVGVLSACPNGATSTRLNLSDFEQTTSLYLTDETNNQMGFAYGSESYSVEQPREVGHYQPIGPLPQFWRTKIST